MYQLILFNVVQNAVKYNKFGSNLTVKTKIIRLDQHNQRESAKMIHMSQEYSR